MIKVAEKDYAKYFQKPNLRQAAKRGREDVKIIDFEMPLKIENIGKAKKFLIDTFGCQMNTLFSAFSQSFRLYRY